MKRLCAALGAISILSGSAAAQPPETPSAVAAQSWSPEWSAPFCTISIGDPKQLALSIWYVPGSSGVEIYFMSDPARARGFPGMDERFDWRGRIVGTVATGANVQMGEGRPLIPVTSLRTIPVATGVVGFAMNVDDFFGNFASSESLIVRQGPRYVGMRYGGAREAMSALQRCIDARLKAWSVDSASLAALKRRPVLRLDSWVHYVDFPREAVADKRAGATVVRLTTDTAGRVRSCTVVQSSGVTALDEITCRKALTRARYKPAIGADGQPTAATFTNYVRFDVFQ